MTAIFHIRLFNLRFCVQKGTTQRQRILMAQKNQVNITWSEFNEKENGTKWETDTQAFTTENVEKWGERETEWEMRE